MGIMTYEHCHRGRKDCSAIHCITSESPDVTEEQYYNQDFEPVSFTCCGRNTSENRVKDQDRYRLCFKSPDTDEMTDNDMQDLTSIMAVASAAMNFDAIMKANYGVVETPFDHEHGDEPNATKESADKIGSQT